MRGRQAAGPPSLPHAIAAIALLVAITALLLPSVAHATAPSVKVAVTPLRMPRTLEPERTRIEEAAAAGLADAGLSAQVGDGAGCDYAVNGTLTRNQDQFSIRMTLVRLADAAELDAISRNCRDEYDLCPPTPDIARDLAGRLGKRLVVELANGSLPAIVSPPPVTPPAAAALQPKDPAPGANAPGAELTTAAPAQPSSLARNLAIASVAVSALAIAAGAVLYFGLDGKSTECRQTPNGQACLSFWDVGALSSVLVGVGIVSLGASSWYLWRTF